MGPSVCLLAPPLDRYLVAGHRTQRNPVGIRSLRWEGPWPAVGVADGVALGVLEGDGGHQEVHLRAWKKGEIR